MLGQDFSFDPEITDDQFREFSSIIGQSIYGSPIAPATPRGLLAFDIGIGAVGVPVDDDAAYWVNAVDEDILLEGYLAVPRLIVSKGLSVANISGSLAMIPDTDVKVWAASVDVPLIGGSLVSPAISVRGAYSQLEGIDELELKTYGAEVFASMTFGPITPYGAAGLMRTESAALIPASPLTAERTLESSFEDERFTVGLRLSLLLPKLTFEATRVDDWAYAAKVSFGF